MKVVKKTAENKGETERQKRKARKQPQAPFPVSRGEGKQKIQ
jgi:hypothetical protein